MDQMRDNKYLFVLLPHFVFGFVAALFRLTVDIIFILIVVLSLNKYGLSFIQNHFAILDSGNY